MHGRAIQCKNTQYNAILRVKFVNVMYACMTGIPRLHVARWRKTLQAYGFPITNSKAWIKNLPVSSAYSKNYAPKCYQFLSYISPYLVCNFGGIGAIFAWNRAQSWMVGMLCTYVNCWKWNNLMYPYRVTKGGGKWCHRKWRWRRDGRSIVRFDCRHIRHILFCYTFSSDVARLDTCMGSDIPIREWECV